MTSDDGTRPRLEIVRSSPIASSPDTSKPNLPAAIGGDLIDEAELAARLGVSRATLQSWRYTKRGPSYIKIGRLIRYRNVDVERFLRENTRGTKDAPPRQAT